MHTTTYRRYRPKRHDDATAPAVYDIAQYDFAFKAVKRAGILVGVYLLVQFSTLEKSFPVYEERECQVAELDGEPPPGIGGLENGNLVRIFKVAKEGCNLLEEGRIGIDQ
jgi:hypothetical protein